MARVAIRLAGKREGRANGDDRENHVGFYLIDKGLARLEELAGARLSFTRRFEKKFTGFLCSSILARSHVITAIFTGCLLVEAHSNGLRGPLLWLIGMISLLAVSQLAIALVNWLTTLLVAPRLLPRMDFSKGIPPESSALVVVPTMLTGTENIEHLTDALEVRFLANQR